MAIVKQGITTINSGAKGEQGIQGIQGVAGSDGVMASIVAGTNVTVDATDPANPIVSSSGVGGASNPNIVVIATEADLVNVAYIDSILELQTDITLTANRTITSNATLKYGGGKIILDGFTLTGDNTSIIVDQEEVILIDAFTGTIEGTWNTPKTISVNNFGTKAEGNEVSDGAITIGTNIFTSATAIFTANDVGKWISIVDAGTTSTEDENYCHVSTITGYTNSTTVTIADNAINTTSATTVVYGWNDRNAIMQASYVRNQKAGELYFPQNNKYYFNVIQANSAIQQVPYSFLIGNDTNGVIWNVDGWIQAFPHEIQDSKSIVIYRTDGSGIKGSGKIYGDYGYHKSENGRGEGNHGVYIATLATNTRLEGSIDCSYWYGDAVYGSGDTQFMNQIDGSNYVDGSTESTIAQGSINETGVIDVADTEWYYTPTLLTLEGGQFDNITSRGLKKFVHLTGASYGGWEGMRTPYFKIAFYDSLDVFMFITNDLTWFDKIPIPDGATQARVVFVTPIDAPNIQLSLRPDLNPDGLIMEGWTLSYCGRQGVSNGPSNATYRNIWGHHIGGLDAGPGYWMDYEDGGRIKKNIIVEGCTMHDNWGDIILKGCENFVIRDNTFKASTIATNNSTYANIETGVGSQFGRNVKIYGNTFYNKQVGLDRQDHFFNNIHKGGTLAYSANGNYVMDNEFLNVYINHAADANRDRLNHPTIFKNNYFRYSMRKAGYWFYNINNAASFIGNDFKWNDVGEWNFAAEESDAFMVAGLNSYDSFYLDQAQTTDFGGVVKNNTYEGVLPDLSVIDYSSGNNRPVMTDTENLIFNMPVEYTYGLPNSYTHKNLILYGWLEYDFNQYEATIISATPVINHIGGKLHLKASDNYPWANNGSNLLATAQKNVSLYFKDFEFIIEQAFTYNGVASQKLFKLDHLGTTVLENCVFDMQGMPNYIMDLTQTGNFGASLGAVTIIDPDFKNGFSVVLRVGDKILYTKPNTNCQSFVDNATALASLGEGYYYKDTTSGKFEVTIA
jgi:hypothetical protein